MLFYNYNVIVTRILVSKISVSVTSSGQPQSIQHKFKSLLLSLCTSECSLVQFWAPVTTKTGQTVLSVSGQPFGVDELYNGFCKYRYHCLNRETSVKGISQLSHIERVFLHRSSEICRDIQSCSIDKFLVKIFADCGIRGYWAIPLFEPGYERHRCVGVLELLYFQYPTYLKCTFEVPIPTLSSLIILFFRLHVVRYVFFNFIKLFLL